MYEKLARGHATAYINSLQDYGRFFEWTEGPRPAKVMDALERSSYSKKPGRVLKRLAPLLRPQFGRVKIEEWTRQYKGITAMGLEVPPKTGCFACRPILDHSTPSAPSLWRIFCWGRNTARSRSV